MASPNVETVDSVELELGDTLLLTVEQVVHAKGKTYLLGVGPGLFEDGQEVMRVRMEADDAATR